MASYRWKKRTNALRSDNRDVVLNISTVLYVLMKKNDDGIHTFSGRRCKTRPALNGLEQALGDSFLKVSRGCLVSVMAIHDVTNVTELTDGESLSYSTRNRNEVAAQLQENGSLRSAASARERSPRKKPVSPIAFADIEMVFNDKCREVRQYRRYR